MTSLPAPVPTSTPPDSRRWRIALLVAGVMLSARICLAFVTDPTLLRLGTDLASVGMSGAMAAILLWTAWVVRPPLSRSAHGWLLLGLGLLLWLGGSLFWLRANLLGLKPSGSLADIFFILFYPLFLSGVLLLPRAKRTPLAWVGLALDLAVATIAGLAALWVLFVGPTIASHFQHEHADPFDLFISLAYPTGDLLVLWAAIALMASGQVAGMRGSSRLLATAAAVLVVTDTIYGYQLLHGTYVSGNWLGIAWNLALALMGLAGAAAQSAHRTTGSPSRSPRAALGPLILSSISFAIAWLVISWSPTVPGLQVVEFGVLAMIILTVVRQALGMMENRTLTARLQALNEDLDGRVHERTAALEVANEHLRQAQKMEAIGRLAGGVAHDFNNLLTVIIGNAELLRRQAVLAPADSLHLESISTTAGRAAELTRQLLAFSRRTPLTPQAIDVTAIVSEVERMLRRVLPPQISLVIETSGPPPIVFADASQLVQVVMNLALNARDALLPAGGPLTIATSRVVITAQTVGQFGDELDARIGEFAVLTIRDAGTGMDEATRARIFEPFFTTKPPGAGTGLGLATVHGIVRQSGGWITVDSAPGHGSTFTIYLDLLHDTPSGVTRIMPAVMPHNLTGTRILLVEDEPAVQLVAFHSLSDLGCEVTKTSNAEEALIAFERLRGQLDLVISDGIMPGLRGQELIARLREQVPGFPAVLCSGYTGEDATEIPADVVFLAKPFTADTIARAVYRALHPTSH